MSLCGGVGRSRGWHRRHSFSLTWPQGSPHPGGLPQPALPVTMPRGVDAPVPAPARAHPPRSGRRQDHRQGEGVRGAEGAGRAAGEWGSDLEVCRTKGCGSAPSHALAFARSLQSIYNIHRSPDVWDRPNEFVPGRWDLDGPMPSEQNTGAAPGRPLPATRCAPSSAGDHRIRSPSADYRYIPFSGGPRKCIGDQFALMEAVVGLAVILKRYTFELVPGFDPGITTGATIHTKNGLFLYVRRRAPVQGTVATVRIAGRVVTQCGSQRFQDDSRLLLPSPAGQGALDRAGPLSGSVGGRVLAVPRAWAPTLRAGARHGGSECDDSAGRADRAGAGVWVENPMPVLPRARSFGSGPTAALCREPAVSSRETDPRDPGYQLAVVTVKEEVRGARGRPGGAGGPRRGLFGSI